MASIAWLVFSSLKKSQKHAGELIIPFPKVFCLLPFSKGVLLRFPFSRVMSSLSQRFPSVLSQISLSQGSKHGSPSSLFQGLSTQFLHQGLQASLLLEESIHSQLQAVIGSSSKLAPPVVVLVWCSDWVDFDPFFRAPCRMSLLSSNRAIQPMSMHRAALDLSPVLSFVDERPECLVLANGFLDFCCPQKLQMTG